MSERNRFANAPSTTPLTSIASRPQSGITSERRAVDRIPTVTVPPGGAPIETPAESVAYHSRAVLDASLGGMLRLNPTLRLHAGLFLLPSPVGGASELLRQTNLAGARAGVSFEFQRLAASVGLGYQRGEPSASPNFAAAAGTPVNDSVVVHHVTLAFAAEFRR